MQRVACTECGYSDGLTHTPSSIISLALPENRLWHELPSLLTDFSKPENLPDVYCNKCTALELQKILERILSTQLLLH